MSEESTIFALQREIENLRNIIIELKQSLNQDIFTLTYNRIFFMECLEEACRESKSPFSVLFVDVDGLKSMNDRFGHAAGDEILLQVAHMLSAAINSNDVLARMGGDEFAILMRDIGDEGNNLLAQRIMDKIHNIDFQIDKWKLSVSVSVGIAKGQKGSVADDILAQADKYMYQDKKRKSAENDNF